MVNGAWHTRTAAAAELSSVTRLAAAAEPRAIGQFCDHPLAAHRPGVGVRAPAVPERPCSPARLRRLYDLMRCNVTLMSRSRGHSDIITLWLSDDGEAHLKSIVKQLFSPPKQKQSIRSSSQTLFNKNTSGTRQWTFMVSRVCCRTEDGDVHFDSAGTERHSATEWKTRSAAGDGSNTVDELCSETGLHPAAWRRRVEAWSAWTLHWSQRQGCMYCTAVLFISSVYRQAANSSHDNSTIYAVLSESHHT